jgi:hypothetical protein
LQRGDVVDFIFDEHVGLLDKCIRWYRKFKKDFAPKLQAIAGTIDGANDKEIAALQAADLLAGQVGSDLRTGIVEPPLELLIARREIWRLPTYPIDLSVLSDLVRLANIWSSTKALDDIKTPNPSSLLD